MPKKVASKKKKGGKDVKDKPKAGPPPDPSDFFVRRFQIWALSNIKKVVHFCHLMDENSDHAGLIAVRQFLGILHDMQAPFKREELEKIASHFPKEERGLKIDYSELESFIKSGHLLQLYQQLDIVDADKKREDTDGLTGDSKGLPLKSVKYQCPNCLISRSDIPLEVNPKFINVHCILATFSHVTQHPGHFHKMVLASQTVQGLKMTIHEHLDGVSKSLALFYKLPCNEENYMKPHYEIGHYLTSDHDVVEEETAKLDIYYDYLTDSAEDAILMAENGLFKVKSTTVRIHNVLYKQ